MIWYYFTLFITSLLTAVFSWLPKVTVLPTIFGVDIEAIMTTFIGYYMGVAVLIWPMYDLYQGAVYMLTYYAVSRLALRMFLGSRSPS